MSRAKFFQAMIWGQLGRIIEMVLSTLLLIFIIRRLSQADFSTYSVVVNLITFLVLIFNFGLNDALNRYIPVLGADDSEAPFWFFSQFLKWRMLGSLIISLALLVLSNSLAVWFNEPLVKTSPLLVPVMYFSYSLFELMISFFSARFWVKQIELIRLVGQLCSLLFIVGWFWWAGSSAFIILVSLCLINAGMNLACVLVAARRGWIGADARFNPAVLAKERISEIKRFSRDAWFIKLFNIGFGGQVDVLILGLLATDPLATGYYNLAALLIVRLWVLFIGWSGALNSIIATVAIEKGAVGLERYFGYYYRFYLFILSASMVGLAVVSTPLIITLFGKRYESVGGLVVILVGQQLINAIAGGTVVQVFLSVMGRQPLMLRCHAFFSLLNVVLDVVLIPDLGALGAVIGTVTANSLMYLVDFWLLRDLGATLDWVFPLKVLAGVISGGLLAGLFGGQTFLSLIVSGSIYVVYLLLFLLLVKPLKDSDRQVLLNLRPGLTRVLQYF